MIDINTVWAAAYGAYCAGRFAAYRDSHGGRAPVLEDFQEIVNDAKAFAQAVAISVVDLEGQKPDPAQEDDSYNHVPPKSVARVKADATEKPKTSDYFEEKIARANTPDTHPQKRDELIGLRSGSNWQGNDVVDPHAIRVTRVITDNEDYVAVEKAGEQVAGLYPQDIAAFMRRNYPLLVGPPKREVATWHPQKRDESRDICVREFATGSIAAEPFTRDGAVGERYVPYSQLVAAQRDSELLDAILEAGEKLRTPNAMQRSIAKERLIDTVVRAVRERSKL